MKYWTGRLIYWFLDVLQEILEEAFTNCYRVSGQHGEIFAVASREPLRVDPQ
jgi:hypothetical protein